MRNVWQQYKQQYKRAENPVFRVWLNLDCQRSCNPTRQKMLHFSCDSNVTMQWFLFRCDFMNVWTGFDKRKFSIKIINFFYNDFDQSIQFIKGLLSFYCFR